MEVGGDVCSLTGLRIEPFPLHVAAYSAYDERPRSDYVYLESGFYRSEPRCAIVIDEGSHSTRVGWASEESPCKSFRTTVGRPRVKGKGIRAAYVGGVPRELTAGQIGFRSPLEKDVLTHGPSQEALLDHAFALLSVGTQGGVEHPLAVTEPLCNPNHCRALSSELLFECYSVPSVCYGLAPLWALSHHLSPQQQPLSSHLVVSLGHTYTLLVPVVAGRIDHPRVRRLSVSGSSVSSLLHSLLELHHPTHRADFALARTDHIKERYCSVAIDYTAHLRLIQAASKQPCLSSSPSPAPSSATPPFHDPTVHIFTGHDSGSPVPDDKKQKSKRCGIILQLPMTALEDKEAKAEEAKKRAEAARERMLKMRQRAQDQKQSRVEALEKELQELQELLRVQSAGSAEEFAALLEGHDLEGEAELLQAFENAQATLMREKGVAPLPESGESSSKVFANEALRKAHEAIQRKKAERQHEKALQEQLRQQQQERARADPEGYLAELRARRNAIQAKQIERLREQRNSRGRVSESEKRRQRKLVQAAFGGDGEGFGDNEDDWAIYKAGDAQKEAVRREEAEMQDLNVKIAQLEAPLLGLNKHERLRREFQIPLAAELIRAPEVIMQPHFIGVDEMGLPEALQHLFQSYPDALKTELAANVYLTGGTALLPNLARRLEREIQAMIPLGSLARVQVSSDPINSAWKGAAEFARDPQQLSASSITRQMYAEEGPEYLVEHQASNCFAPSPKVDATSKVSQPKRQRR